MSYQRSAQTRRILPPSLRPQRSRLQSQVQHPTKVQWLVTWLGASALSLIVLGLLLEMHC